MSATDIARQFEAADLERAKNLTQSMLQNWDFTTWDELLDDDVILSHRLGSIGTRLKCS